VALSGGTDALKRSENLIAGLFHFVHRVDHGGGVALTELANCCPDVFV
jgi:hypothetical protein